jgi:hypothetical protein
MKSVSKLVAGGLLLVALAVPAHAQGPYVFLGGGLSMPMSDTKDHVKSGWMVTGGIGKDIGTSGLFVEAEGFYGSNKVKGGGTGDVTFISGLGAVGYSFMRENKVRPYVLGGAGILSSKNGASESQFAYSGAAGLGIRASEKINVWFEGRYLATKDVTLIPILAGVTISF